MEKCGISGLTRQGLTKENIITWVDCYKNLSKTIQSQGCIHDDLKGLCPKETSSMYCVRNSARNSFYAIQILEWLELFGENLMVIRSEDFYSHTEEIMAQVVEFMGLSYFDWSPFSKKAYNIETNRNIGKPGFLSVEEITTDKTKNYPPLDSTERKELEKFFHPLNVALGRLLGKQNFWNY